MSMSKQHKVDKGLEVKWTTEDFDRCVDLIVKAKQRPGAFESVMTRVNRIEAGHHGEFLACGLADGDYAECDEFVKPHPPIFTGGMSDASKRQRESDEFSMSSGVPSDAAGYTIAAPKTPPFVTTDIPRVMVPQTLPPGVASIGEWGDYKVAFGKFKKIKCYKDVLNEQTAEMASYRAYLISHEASGSAMLRDLVAYLRAAGFQGEKTNKPVIPGTHIVREK